MKIASGLQVTVEYTLKLEDGTVVDTNVGGTPLTYTQGSGELIPGLERELIGMQVGDRKEVAVQPEDGYGALDKEAILEMSKDQIPEDALHVGANLQGRGPDGQAIRGHVSELRGQTVLVDFNHPLAGRVLYFTVEVLDIQRAAESSPHEGG